MMLTDDELFLKLVIYGKSGTGKTTLGASAPHPFFLLSERQGFRSVRDAARRLNAPTPPTMWLQTMDDMRVCLKHLRANGPEPIAEAMREILGKSDATEAAIAALPYVKPDSIVCDSMTDFFRMVSEDIMVGLGFPKAKDGQEVRSDRYWDLLRSRCDRLVTLLRDMPYHVVMLCLLDDRMVGKDDEATRSVGPDTPMRALASNLLAATNACGCSYQDQKSTLNDKGEPVFEHEWKVRFRGPRYMVLKSCEPLRDVETPDVSDWIMRVLAHDADLGHGEQAERDARTGAEPAAQNPDTAVSGDAPATKPTTGPRRRATTAATTTSEGAKS
jgi:hypothetical protein